MYQNTSKFPGELSQNSLRMHRIFQEEKYHKNRSKFPGILVQNFVGTHNIFQETIPRRTDSYFAKLPLLSTRFFLEEYIQDEIGQKAKNI